MNMDAKFFVDDTRLELRDCASAHIYNSLSSLYCKDEAGMLR